MVYLGLLRIYLEFITVGLWFFRGGLGLFGVGSGIICDWFKVDFGFAYNLFKVRLGFV